MDFLSCFHSTGQSFQNNVGFNDEYERAVRAESYVELSRRVQKKKKQYYKHLSSYLFRPPIQHLLPNGGDDSTRRPHLHRLVLDYLDGAFIACDICGSLLVSVDQARTNHTLIQRVLRRTKRLKPTGNHADERRKSILADLARFATLVNPLSASSSAANPVQFQRVHDLFDPMIPLLTSAHQKVMRRVKILKLRRCNNLVPCGGWRRRRGRWLARMGAQLDAAARGAYTLVRGLETMSRMAARVEDEIERRGDVVRMFMGRRRGGGRREEEEEGLVLLREVVRELQRNEVLFMEQLKELEEHIYLYILTIERARRLVFQQLVAN